MEEEHICAGEQIAPQEWLDALERADADLKAGRSRPWSEVRAEALAKIEAAKAVRSKQEA